MKRFLHKPLILLTLMLIGVTAKAQSNFHGTYFSISNFGALSTNGPQYSVLPVTLEKNTDKSIVIGGGITVTASYSNQQYTGLSDFGSSGNPYNALLFGIGDNSTTKQKTSQPTFVAMNSVGSPSNSFYSATQSLIGSGIDVSTNYAFNQFAASEGFVPPFQTLSLISGAAYYMGDVTYTFSRPVDNPIIHITGLGGFLSIPDIFSALPISAELELVSGQATSLTYISGTMAPRLAPPQDLIRMFDIKNGNYIQSNYSEGYFAVLGITGTSGVYAGSGSAVVNGTNISSVTFKVYLRGKSSDQQWSSYPGDTSETEVFSGDRYNVTFSLAAYPLSGQVVVDNLVTDPNIIESDASFSTYPGVLYAILVNENDRVIAVQTVNSTTGLYNFGEVMADNYKVVLSITNPTIGTTFSSDGSLAPNWTGSGQTFNNTASNISELDYIDNKTLGQDVNFANFSTAVGGSFSIFQGIGENVSILPVTLVFFTGNMVGDEAVLNWLTASELNNSGFEVEHSLNGIDFESIGWVNGNGTTNIPNTYNFVQENLSGGIHYYRLKQIDFDGVFEYSNIISLEYKSNVKVKIFPVPAQNMLNVNINSKDIQNAQLNIVDVSGKRLRTITQVNSNNQIDLSYLPSGSYFIQINWNNNQVETYPFSIIK